MVSAFAGRELILEAYRRGDPRALSVILAWRLHVDPVKNYQNDILILINLSF